MLVVLFEEAHATILPRYAAARIPPEPSATILKNLRRLGGDWDDSIGWGLCDYEVVRRLTSIKTPPVTDAALKRPGQAIAKQPVEPNFSALGNLKLPRLQRAGVMRIGSVGP